MKKTTILIKSLALTFVLNVCNSTFLIAQKIPNENVALKAEDLPQIIKTSAIGNFYADFNNKKISVDFLKTNLRKWLGTKDDHSFLFIKSTTDELGITHSTYQHYYKNIKVDDEVILVHEKDNFVTFVNGELTSDIDISIKSPLANQEIYNIVEMDMRSTKIRLSNIQQVIAKVITKNNVKVALVARADAFSGTKLSAYTYFIDNSNKQIIKKLEKFHNHNNISASLDKYSKFFIDTPSTSSTFYRGNQQITVDSHNGGYRLKDNLRNIHTFDGTAVDGTLDSNGNLNYAIDYTNLTPNYTSDNTKPAIDVHYGMKTAYEYYLTKHNRNSYDGNGSIIKNYYNINFAAPGDPYYGANAGAYDEAGNVFMVYGNGNYNGSTALFNPYTALDVAGHEYSHLIISRTANLAYQGESGALNESFADIFGTSIEFFSGSNSNWTIGEGIPKPILGTTFLRSMSNPNSGSSILGSQQPDTYQGTFWASTLPPYNDTNDYGGVHTNSGVANYWFYLLSTGGTGTNDIGNAYNVTGITITKAEKIAYRTLTNYLTANSQFIDAYNSSKQAVTDLYGATSNEQQQNVKAWYAVGIGNGVLSTAETFALNNDDIVIYPNPVIGKVINVDSKISNATYEIFDTSGKLVQKKQILNSGNNKIKISELQSGIYIFNVSTQKGNVSKKIIVK